MLVHLPVSAIPRRLRVVFLTLLIGLAAASLALYVPRYVTPVRSLVGRMGASIYDWLYNRRGAEGKIPEVVIVQMDKNSIENMMEQEHFSYPFPRAVHAEVLRNLKEAGAKVIGMDIVFDATKDPQDDQALQSAMKSCGNVVVAADFSGSETAGADVASTGQDFPIPAFRDAAAAFGPVDVDQDEGDYAVRRFHLALKHPSLADFTQDEQYPGFAVQAAALYAGISQEQLKAGLQHRMFGDYYVPRASDYWGTYELGSSARICFTDRPFKSTALLEYDQVWSAKPGTQAMQELRKAVSGKIVLIGSTEESEHDNFFTPLREQDDPKRPGVEVQANIIHTLLAHHAYTAVPDGMREALLFSLAVLAALLTFQLRPVKALLPVLVMLAAVMALDVTLFDHRLFMRPSEVLGGILLAYVLEGAYVYFIEEARARDARRHFSRYVGPRVMEKVLDGGHVPLTGEKRYVTIMFTDVQGFTSLSEKLSPAEAVSVLNLYLDKMVECIFRHEGTLDKIMGDGIMAYFGAPAPIATPELQAVQCAIEMQQLMQEWRARSEKEGMPPLNKRIGIHAGEVIVGEVGCANQVGYTLIGDAVNVAARLEPLNKEYHTEILISQEVADKLPGSIEVVHQGEVPIRGRKEAVHAYSVQVPPVGSTTSATRG